MIADEDRTAVHGGGEISCDDRSRRRLQSRGQIFLIFDENEMIFCGGIDAGHSTYCRLRVAYEARAHRISDLL